MNFFARNTSEKEGGPLATVVSIRRNGKEERRERQLGKKDEYEKVGRGRKNETREYKGNEGNNQMKRGAITE